MILDRTGVILVELIEARAAGVAGIGGMCHARGELSHRKIPFVQSPAVGPIAARQKPHDGEHNSHTPPPASTHLPLPVRWGDNTPKGPRSRIFQATTAAAAVSVAESRNSLNVGTSWTPARILGSHTKSVNSPIWLATRMAKERAAIPRTKAVP